MKEFFYNLIWLLTLTSTTYTYPSQDPQEAFNELATTIANTSFSLTAPQEFQKEIQALEGTNMPECFIELNLEYSEFLDRSTYNAFKASQDSDTFKHMFAMMKVFRQKYGEGAPTVIASNLGVGAQTFLEKKQEEGVLLDEKTVDDKPQTEPEVKTPTEKQYSDIEREKKEDKLSTLIKALPLNEKQQKAYRDFISDFYIDEQIIHVETILDLSQEQQIWYFSERNIIEKKLDADGEGYIPDVAPKDVERAEIIQEKLKEVKKMGVDPQPLDNEPRVMHLTENELQTIINLFITEMKDVLPNYGLDTLHESIYDAFADKKKTEAYQPVLQTIFDELIPKLRDLSLYLQGVDTSFILKNTELQALLNRTLAQLIACFDALIAARIDKNKSEPQQTSSSWWPFGSRETEEEKKEKQINHFQNMLTSFQKLGPLLVNNIEEYYDIFSPYLNTKDAYEKGRFDVVTYAPEIQKSIVLPGNERIFDYLYKRTSTDKSYVTQLHKKNYQNIIATYQKMLQEYLEKLGVTFEQQPTIQQALTDLSNQEKQVTSPQKVEGVEKSAEKILAETKKVIDEPTPTQEQPAPEPPAFIIPSQPFQDEEGAEDIEIKIEDDEEPEEVEVTVEVEQDESAKEIQDAIRQLQQTTQQIKQRTQELISAHNQNEQTRYNLMFTKADLEKHFEPIEALQRFTPPPQKAETIIQQFSESLTNYCNQLVLMTILDTDINGQTITTLHQSAASNPFDFESWSDHMQIIMQQGATQQLIETIQVIEGMQPKPELTNLNRAIASLCAVFDAVLFALSQQTTIDAQDDISLETYTQQLSLLASTFEPNVLSPFLEAFQEYLPQTTAQAYEAETFDITQAAPDLLADNKYQYRIEPNTKITIEENVISIPEINAQHKKEYESLIESITNAIEAKESLKNINQTIDNLENPTIEQINEQLKTLEEIKDDISTEEYESLKKQLEDKKAPLEVAQKQIEAELAAFKKQITDGQKLLNEQKKLFTVNFEKPYKTIQELLGQFKGLKEPNEEAIAEMITIFKAYITQVIETVIDLTGLNVLHRNVQGKQKTDRSTIEKAVQPTLLEAIATMLNQLKQFDLFGINSSIDYQSESSRPVVDALIKGFLYILVAHDAVEATLYEGFSTTEKITQWVRYLWTEGKEGTETIYDKAIETIDGVMNIINKARTTYYDILIDPFFEGEKSGSYKDMYNQSKLDATRYELENIMDETGDYIYKRSRPEYKQVSLSISEITPNHKKNYLERQNSWKDQLKVVFKDELLARTQNNVIAQIKNLIPYENLQTISIPFTKDTIEHFFDRLVQTGAQYASITKALQELAQENKINKAIITAVERTFAYILATYDAMAASVYDVTTRANMTKEEKYSTIEYTLNTLKQPLIDAIQTFYATFAPYMSQAFKQQYEAGTLSIASLTNLERSLDSNNIKVAYQLERPANYTSNYPQQGFLTSNTAFKQNVATYKAQSLSNFSVDTKVLNFIVVDTHKKAYDTLLSWQETAVQIKNPIQEKLLEQNYAGITITKLAQTIKTDKNKAYNAIELMIQTMPFSDIATTLAQQESLPAEYQNSLHEVTQALEQAYQATIPQPKPIPFDIPFTSGDSNE